MINRLNKEGDRDPIEIPLPIATSCREQSSLLQKTRNNGISIALTIRSVDRYYKSNLANRTCVILNCNDYSVQLEDLWVIGSHPRNLPLF